MANVPLLDIRPDHWALVRAILYAHVPQYEVWAFGSRATWQAKPYSDLDLAILSAAPLPLALSAALADAFSEADLPWRVDVLDWTTTSPSFRAIVQRDKVVVQKKRVGHYHGDEMSEWPLVPIGTVAEIFDGPHATPKTVEVGPVFLGIGSLQDGRLDLGETRHVTPNDFTTWTRRVKPQTDDVVFSYETRLGQAAIIPEGLECCLGRRMGLVRADQRRLNPRFFLYVYLSPSYQDFLRSKTIHGATVERLALKEFPSFPIPLPPLPIQHAIAHILGSLDDKIELNRRMNETLEAMARALFKDWFVDFGPVRAKADGRQPPGLAADIAALFPDALDAEEKPVGWEILPLDEVADFLNGLALQKFPGDADDDLPIIKIAELRAGFVDNGVRASKTIPSQYVIENGDAIFSWSGSLIQRIWTGGKGALNQHLFKVTSTRFPKWFHYYWVEHHLSNFQAIAASKATTMGHIQRHHLTEAKTIVGSDALMKAADAIFAPLFSQIVANCLESRTLAALRDLLLPKLLSGEMRVREAEQVVTGAR